MLKINQLLQYENVTPGVQNYVVSEPLYTVKKTNKKQKKHWGSRSGLCRLYIYWYLPYQKLENFKHVFNKPIIY